MLNRVVQQLEIKDVGVAILEFESGALGTIADSYVSPRTYSIRLHGTDAVLEYRADMSVWPDAARVDERTTLTLAGEPVEFEQIDRWRSSRSSRAASPARASPRGRRRRPGRPAGDP